MREGEEGHREIRDVLVIIYAIWAGIGERERVRVAWCKV